MGALYRVLNFLPILMPNLEALGGVLADIAAGI